MSYKRSFHLQENQPHSKALVEGSSHGVESGEQKKMVSFRPRYKSGYICSNGVMIATYCYTSLPFLPIMLQWKMTSEWKETNIGGTHFHPFSTEPWLWEEG